MLSNENNGDEETDTIKDLFSHIVDEYCAFLNEMKSFIHNTNDDLYSYYQIEAFNDNNNGFRLFRHLQQNRTMSILYEILSDMSSTAYDSIDYKLFDRKDELCSIMLSLLGRIDLFNRPSLQVRWYLLFMDCLFEVIFKLNDLDHSKEHSDDRDLLAWNLCIIKSIIDLKENVINKLIDSLLILKLEYIHVQMQKRKAAFNETETDEEIFYTEFDMSKDAIFISKDAELYNANLMDDALNRINNSIDKVLGRLAKIALRPAVTKSEQLSIYAHKTDTLNAASDTLSEIWTTSYSMCNLNYLFAIFNLSLAKCIDLFFYEKIITWNYQLWKYPASVNLNADVVNHWIKLLTFQKHSNLAENSTDTILPKSINSLRILCMNDATAKYMRDQIREAQSDNQALTYLNEFNITNLNREQALFILSLRDDMSI
ncbi:hypothetical protein GJ496_001197 [Pomphorhynchus laevis]|nr:hypothetical protein GJ496_001197 [Pomphorhynchus laevis]